MEHHLSGEGLAGLAQEWVALQSHHEQYEQSALLIKLAGVVLAAAGWVMVVNVWGLAMLLAILWLQEGIYRTSQSRLGERLLKVEQLLKGDSSNSAEAFQLHSEWLAGRAGLTGLLAEYAGSAVRPTVAFPHVVLIVLALAAGVMR